MIAILSDIHGNLPALEAVLQDARSRGCTRLISLGDIAGYYAQPGDCIHLLQQYQAVNILGNHDSYLVNNSNCSRSRVVSSIVDYHKQIVTPTQLGWLKRSLPLLREGTRLFVHGGPDDPQDQYLYEISVNTIPSDIDILFSGHTHVQVLMEFGQKIFCNPGSVGQPRDGDCRAAYATLDGTRITLCRVDYDIERTALMMKQAGFDRVCYENLYNGTQIGGRIDQIKMIS